MAETIVMKRGDVCDIRVLADRYIKETGAEFVSEETSCGGRAVLLCFEKYYYRVGSYVSLTIMLSQETDSTRAVIVGFGGGAGLLNISLGANESLAEDARSFFSQNGFETV